MYKHVLVAVDGSACARQALTEAVRIASACHGHLEIVHVIDYTFLQYETGYGIRADLVPELLELGNNLLRDAGGVAEQAGVRYTRTLIDNVISLGDVAGQLLEHVTKSGADMVVVGTHGRRGLKRVFLGSVAESLARACPVPVLLVRESVSEPGNTKLEELAEARP